MGGGSSFSFARRTGVEDDDLIVDVADDDSDNDGYNRAQIVSRLKKGKLAKLDCKGYAARLVISDRTLSPVRGYLLTDEGFSEHWWCVHRPTQTVVDITNFGLLKGTTHVALTERDEHQVSLCDALVGPCQMKPKCEWCVARGKLEKKGKQRRWLKEPNSVFRLMLDVLYQERSRMAEELERMRQDLGEASWLEESYDEDELMLVEMGEDE